MATAKKSAKKRGPKKLSPRSRSPKGVATERITVPKGTIVIRPGQEVTVEETEALFKRFYPNLVMPSQLQQCRSTVDTQEQYNGEKIEKSDGEKVKRSSFFREHIVATNNNLHGLASALSKVIMYGKELGGISGNEGSVKDKELNVEDQVTATISNLDVNDGLTKVMQQQTELGAKLLSEINQRLAEFREFI